jgi:hypothetical protein
MLFQTPFGLGNAAASMRMAGLQGLKNVPAPRKTAKADFREDEKTKNRQTALSGLVAPHH